MGIIVNKYLYIEHEQHPLYKIFNEKINQMSRTKATRQSQRTYPKNNGGT
jgi:hypothetical protein